MNWPDIPYTNWKQTCAALHLYCQVVGKYRLARTPWINHSWHATFYVNARGLTTSLVPDGPGGTEIVFDLISHEVIAMASDGQTGRFPLQAGSVANFYQRFTQLLVDVGANPEFSPLPSEIPDALPFQDDHAERPYDAEAVTRFFQALVQVDRVFKLFRTGFLGKVSPVHLFWGSLDLAVTRFSGQKAPRHPGGFPGLPDKVTSEAYSHQVSSAGFWPGGGGVEFPAFYAYAYPSPDGFSQAIAKPDASYFDTTLGEFILPYDAVRSASNPESTLMDFLESTYSAASQLGGWNTAFLDCPIGQPMHPRELT
ncbi:hypothetical protein G3A39_41520 [Paraburkholderia aspalathi]|nr:hypothetical protein [Paraburkholderia aspalathi]